MVEQLCHGISGVTGVVSRQGSANHGTGGVASSWQWQLQWSHTSSAGHHEYSIDDSNKEAMAVEWQQNWSSLLAAVMATTGATVEGQWGQRQKSYSTSDSDKQHQ